MSKHKIFKGKKVFSDEKKKQEEGENTKEYFALSKRSKNGNTWEKLFESWKKERNKKKTGIPEREQKRLMFKRKTREITKRKLFFSKKKREKSKRAKTLFL